MPSKIKIADREIRDIACPSKISVSALMSEARQWPKARANACDSNKRCYPRFVLWRESDKS
jgi:hypothetical protein